MTKVSVNFEFLECEHQDIIIQCTPKQKMSEVIDSFKDKVKSEIELNDYLFYNRNKQINQDLKVSDFKNQIINISVRKIKSSNLTTKCPECDANTCFLKIENYGLHFYGCIMGHDVIKTFSKYKISQNLNDEDIKCDRNGETRAQGVEIYKCLTCSKSNGVSYYICEKCLKSHNEKGQHETIKYDDKNYICLDNCEYSSYCETCKKDLCEICYKEHKNKNHKITKYDDITPKILERQRELEEIKTKIENLKAGISQLVKNIEQAYEILDKYYKICKDIVDKYNSYNKEKRNYHIIQNINFLEKSNKEVMGHLDILLKKDNSKESLINKCGLLVDIFDKERKNYDKKNPNVKEVPQKENNNNKQNLNQNKKNVRSINNKSNGN